MMGNKKRKQGDIDCQEILAQDDIVGSVAANEVFLVSHLRKLINRTECSDFEFICKDGVHVHASRIFLVGRSALFDSMLTNGMRETNASIINLPEISSAAFLSILEFLYTGNLSDFQPTTWKAAFEIISAADFCLLQGVEKIAREYIWMQMSHIIEEPHRAATMLTEALESKCFRHDEDTALLRLVEVLDRKWMHEDCVCNLSEEAVNFLMRQTKPKMEDRMTLSLDEYFRFRGVLLWCLLNSHFVPREEALKLVSQQSRPSKRLPTAHYE